MQTLALFFVIKQMCSSVRKASLWNHSRWFVPSVLSGSFYFWLVSILPRDVRSSLSVDSPLSPSISLSLVHSSLKIHVFYKSFPSYRLLSPSLMNAVTDEDSDRIFCANQFLNVVCAPVAADLAPTIPVVSLHWTGISLFASYSLHAVYTANCLYI